MGIHTRISPIDVGMGLQQDARNCRGTVKGEIQRRLGMQRSNLSAAGAALTNLGPGFFLGSPWLVAATPSAILEIKDPKKPDTVPDPTQTAQGDATLSGEINYVLQFKTYSAGSYSWNDNGSDDIFLSVDGTTGAAYVMQFGLQTHSGAVVITDCGNGQLDISGTLAPTENGTSDVTVTKECV